MDSEYTRRLEKIEAVIRAALPREEDPAWLDRTFPGLALNEGHTRGLTAPCLELLERGGKRWRPLLALLVCEAAGEEDAVLPLTPLVEFPHNASLIHDDIEDRSEQRRGGPAIHRLYGEDAAINSGAFLYFLPLSCLETWNAQSRAKERVWRLWGEHLRRLHLGQSLDIIWHNDTRAFPSTEEYLLMCSLKTGSLARFAALVGLAAACARQEQGTGGSLPPAANPPGFPLPPLFPGPGFQTASRLYADAAEKLGVGFQILDDVKNLSEGVPGKERGDDIVEGKKSLPVLLFLAARPDQAGFAASCFAGAREQGASSPPVEAFIQAMRAEGVLETARARGETLIAEARAAFSRPLCRPEENPAPAAAEGSRLLAGLADMLR
jgi:octaprenyl-diphosphate synthase